ncbi:unnamed protein product [Penicillium bialowiezense]
MTAWGGTLHLYLSRKVQRVSTDVHIDKIEDTDVLRWLWISWQHLITQGLAMVPRVTIPIVREKTPMTLGAGIGAPMMSTRWPAAARSPAFLWPIADRKRLQVGEGLSRSILILRLFLPVEQLAAIMILHWTAALHERLSHGYEFNGFRSSSTCG